MLCDSTVKEPGHFEVSSRPQNTGRQRRFTVKIKQIKPSDMVTFLFSVHTITEAKQYAGLGRAVDLPARSFDPARPDVAPPLVSSHTAWDAG